MHDTIIEQPAPNAVDPTKLPRDQRSDFWSQQIQMWQQSGLSQVVFCRQHNLVLHQFTYWHCKSKPLSTPVKRNATFDAFIPVTVTATTPSPLQITLPNGIVFTGITVENLDVVREFVQSL